MGVASVSRPHSHIPHAASAGSLGRVQSQCGQHFQVGYEPMPSEPLLTY